MTTTAINKQVISEHLHAWHGYDAKEIKENGEAFNSTFRKGEKCVYLCSPYEVGEFHLDFEEKRYRCLQ